MTRACAAIVAATCLVTPASAQDAAPGEGLTLAQAIARALAGEPATQAATADVDVARGLTRQAALRANPSVSLERRQEPGGADTATGISVEWPLELHRRGPRVAVAEAEVRAAEHAEADARRQLASEVAAAYGEVAAVTRQLAILDEQLAAAGGQLELLRARAADGAVPSLDRDIVDVEVRRLQAERRVESGRVERALVRLKRLLGMRPDAPLRVVESLEELVASIPPPAGAGAARSDVLAAEARVRIEEQRLTAARAEGRTDVSVFGSYMRMDNGFPQQGVRPGGGLERIRGQFNYLTAGATVTVPLWNRQQGSIAAAAAAREAASARLEAARLTAASEVADARVRVEAGRDVVASYRDGIRPLARRNLETVRETYQLGRATVFDVLAEQRRYLEVERAYTDALAEAHAAGVSLRRAIGDRP